MTTGGVIVEEGIGQSDGSNLVIDLLVNLRRAARHRGDYATADAVRRGLAGLGVEVHDLPTGTTWTLAGE